MSRAIRLIGEQLQVSDQTVENSATAAPDRRKDPRDA